MVYGKQIKKCQLINYIFSRHEVTSENQRSENECSIFLDCKTFALVFNLSRVKEVAESQVFHEYTSWFEVLGRWSQPLDYISQVEH
jgi:hypothetical protein